MERGGEHDGGGAERAARPHRHRLDRRGKRRCEDDDPINQNDIHTLDMATGAWSGAAYGGDGAIGALFCQRHTRERRGEQRDADGNLRWEL